MNPFEIINKYYQENTDLYNILVEHSKDVADKSLSIVRNHPEFNIDENFVYEAAMLHDIGIFMTDSSDIECYGDKPYICHGYLGSDLVKKEGFPLHALVCERHTGVGLSLEYIISKNLPLPHRDMQPVSLEEQIICFADKFFSKTRLGKEKSVDKIRSGLSKYGQHCVDRFDEWDKLFGE